MSANQLVTRSNKEAQSENNLLVIRSTTARLIVQLGPLLLYMSVSVAYSLTGCFLFNLRHKRSPTLSKRLGEQCLSAWVARECDRCCHCRLSFQSSTSAFVGEGGGITRPVHPL